MSSPSNTSNTSTATPGPVMTKPTCGSGGMRIDIPRYHFKDNGANPIRTSWLERQRAQQAFAQQTSTLRTSNPYDKHWMDLVSPGVQEGEVGPEATNYWVHNWQSSRGWDMSSPLKEEEEKWLSRRVSSSCSSCAGSPSEGAAPSPASSSGTP